MPITRILLTRYLNVVLLILFDFFGRFLNHPLEICDGIVQTPFAAVMMGPQSADFLPGNAGLPVQFAMTGVNGAVGTAHSGSSSPAGFGARPFADAFGRAGG